MLYSVTCFLVVLFFFFLFWSLVWYPFLKQRLRYYFWRRKLQRLNKS